MGWNKRQLGQVDTETGEIIEGYVAVLQPKRRNGYGQRWAAMSQNAMDWMAANITRGEDWRVFMALNARLDFENLIQVPQSEIANHLGMNRHHVNRSIKRLVRLGVLLEGPKIGRSRSYRLNPYVGWKGSAKKHHEALQERMKAANMSVVSPDQQQRDELESKGQQRLDD